MLTEFQSICRKKVAMVVSGAGAGGDLSVYLGEIILNEKACYYFVNHSQHWEIETDRDIIVRLLPVSKEMKGLLLGADYYFSMIITELRASLFMQALHNA